MRTKNLKTAGWVITALFVVGIYSQSIATAASVGNKAPAFSLQTHDGKTFKLENLKGKRGVVLVFFATWCPYCMVEVPEVKNFVEQSKGKNILVYGVNLRQPQHVVDKFVADYKVNYRILLDTEGAVAKRFGVRGIPFIAGIDANGVIQFTGHKLPEDKEGLIKTLTAPLAPMKAEPKAEEPVATDVQTVNRETLKRWIDSGEKLTIVDVLSPASYHKAHIEGAINIPFAQADALAHRFPKEGKLVVYCANFKCKASTKIAQKLATKGYTNVYDYEGGIADWLEGDLPANKGEHEIRFITKEELQELKKKNNNNLIIIDTLGPENYKSGHIPGAINIPYKDLARKIDALDKNATIVTYCANYICQASSKAAEILLRAGFKTVYDYKGGVYEWKESGLPLEMPQ